MKRIVGLDTETYDPYLTEKGTSWVYKEGEVLCTSLYYVSTGKKKVIKKWNEEVRSLLLDPEVTIIGANIGYDIGWLEHEMGIRGKTKAKLYDIIIAESLINEYDLKNLDFLASKYLDRHKAKTRIEAWAVEQGYKGDFRKYLRFAPWELLKEYAADDAELPPLIMQQQDLILDKEGLRKPYEIDCALIKIVLGMKQKGARLDLKAKARNHKILQVKFDRLKEEFIKKYRKINFGSSKQKAKLFDDMGVNYSFTFTLKSFDGSPYGPTQSKKACEDVSDFVKGFRIRKKKPTCYVEKKYVDRMKKLLDKAGFTYTANPHIDKNVLEGLAEAYPVAKAIKDLGQIQGIISKFLGPNFDRYIVDGRVYADFNISKSDDFGTISGRFSASNPNTQQIPSKGESDDLILAKLCRELFIPEENCWLLKIDYSQIEYRLLVHYARGPGAEAARQRFRDDPETDYHKFVMELTKLERKPAKNCNFGIMYGMGLEGMMEAFGWTRAFAQNVLDVYHEALQYVAVTMAAVSDRAKEKGYITTIGGRRARLRNKSQSFTMLNRLNQGGSADMMKTAMVQMDAEGLFDILTPHITVHDELVVSVPKTRAGLLAAKRLKEIMETCIPLSIPVIAKAEFGPNWYDVEEFDMDEKLKEIA